MRTALYLALGSIAAVLLWLWWARRQTSMITPATMLPNADQPPISLGNDVSLAPPIAEIGTILGPMSVAEQFDLLTEAGFTPGPFYRTMPSDGLAPVGTYPPDPGRYFAADRFGHFHAICPNTPTTHYMRTADGRSLPVCPDTIISSPRPDRIV